MIGLSFFYLTVRLARRILWSMGNYTTRAAFVIGNSGAWTWVRWTHREPNKHAAILDKAKEIGASAWDFGQADHAETSRFSF